MERAGFHADSSRDKFGGIVQRIVARFNPAPAHILRRLAGRYAEVLVFGSRRSAGFGRSVRFGRPGRRDIDV